MYISKLNHEEIRNLNRLITSKQNESVSKNLPTSKSTGPDNFTNKSYQTFQKELTLLLKLLVLNIFKNFVKMAGLGAEGVPISMRSLLLT